MQQPRSDHAHALLPHQNDIRPTVPFVSQFPGISFAMLPINGFHETDVTPMERACASGWSSRRAREFLTGRACARIAAGALRLDLPSLTITPGGAPAWPAGLRGSISHNSGFAVAALTNQPSIVSLGIDIEQADQIGSELLTTICRPAELETIATLECQAAADRAGAIFTLKEAFYKAQYAVTGEWLEFHDVETHWSDGAPHILPMKRESAIFALDPTTLCESTKLDEMQFSLVVITSINGTTMKPTL